MKRWFRESGGKVVEILDQEPATRDENGQKLYDHFPPGMFTEFDNDQVRVGWRHLGALSFVEPDQGGAVSVDGLIEHVRQTARSKIAALTNPLTGDPVSVATDPQTVTTDSMRAQLDASRYMVRDDADQTLVDQIKSAFGTVDLILAASAALKEKVRQAQITTLGEVDNAPEWP